MVTLFVTLHTNPLTAKESDSHSTKVIDDSGQVFHGRYAPYSYSNQYYILSHTYSGGIRIYIRPSFSAYKAYEFLFKKEDDYHSPSGVYFNFTKETDESLKTYHEYRNRSGAKGQKVFDEWKGEGEKDPVKNKELRKSIEEAILSVKPPSTIQLEVFTGKVADADLEAKLMKIENYLRDNFTIFNETGSTFLDGTTFTVEGFYECGNTLCAYSNTFSIPAEDSKGLEMFRLFFDVVYKIEEKTPNNNP